VAHLVPRLERRDGADEPDGVVTDGRGERLELGSEVHPDLVGHPLPDRVQGLGEKRPVERPGPPEPSDRRDRLVEGHAGGRVAVGTRAEGTDPDLRDLEQRGTALEEAARRLVLELVDGVEVAEQRG
jgi:hypothetical protein